MFISTDYPALVKNVGYLVIYIFVLNFDQLASLSIFKEYGLQILLVTFKQKFDWLIMIKLFLAAA